MKISVQLLLLRRRMRNCIGCKKIAEIVHRYGKILIVDEAHGAHFAFHEAFPESAVFCGADAVIQSIHKTLPSLTQTALLHLQEILIKSGCGGIGICIRPPVRPMC